MTLIYNLIMVLDILAVRTDLSHQNSRMYGTVQCEDATGLHWPPLIMIYFIFMTLWLCVVEDE